MIQQLQNIILHSLLFSSVLLIIAYTHTHTHTRLPAIFSFGAASQECRSSFSGASSNRSDLLNGSLCEALNKRPRSGHKDSLKKLKSRAVPQVSRSQSSPCWVCWVGRSGAAWCHGGDAFAGQLEKGRGYIWSQPLTGEHLCLVPLTEQGKEEQSVSSGSKRSLFFTQKLFAESSLLFLFSACFVIYCVRLARGCAVCQESKHADNAAVLCYPEGRACHAQHFRLAYDSGWLCRLWDNYVF